MSTEPFDALREDRRYFREIDNHHNNHLIAKSLQHLEKLSQQQVLAGLRQAAAVTGGEQIRAGELGPSAVLEAISCDIRAMAGAVEDLVEGQARTTQAVNTLAGIVAQGMQYLAQQAARQHQEAQDVREHPVRTEARELARAAEEHLKIAVENPGKDQRKLFKIAIEAFSKVLRNPRGDQDYITWFHIGFLRWKAENDLSGAEEAFDQARLLSMGAKDVWYFDSIRHMAEMQHRQGRHADAYSTIRPAALRRDGSNYFGDDVLVLFDAARYLARADRTEDYIKFLEGCIRLEPLTIGSMFGEPDFNTTDINRAALIELRERLVDAKRAEVRESLAECLHLSALRRAVGEKAKFRIRALRLSAAELGDFDKNVEDADYVTLLSILPKVRDCSQAGRGTIWESLSSEVNALHAALPAAQAALSNARCTFDHQLAQLRMEKTWAEDCVLRARDSAQLPEKPALASKDRGTGQWIIACITAYFLIAMGPQMAGYLSDLTTKTGAASREAGLNAARTLLGILCLGFVGYLIDRLSAYLRVLPDLRRWQSACAAINENARTTEAEAQLRLTTVTAEYPDKVKAIEEARLAAIPPLESALTEILARKAALAEALEFFNANCQEMPPAK